MTTSSVQTWANGFGIWHARVPVTSDSREVAHRAIHRELVARDEIRPSDGHRLYIRPVADPDRIPFTVTYAER
jgi:hypothetical protein